MSEDRDFDRLVQSWLESRPYRAPEVMFETIREAVARTAQVRGARGFPLSRWPSANRAMSFAAVALAIVVVAGGGLWLSAPRNQIVGPGPAPSPSPVAPSNSATPSATPSPSPSPQATPSAATSPSAASAAPTTTRSAGPTTAPTPQPSQLASATTGNVVAIASGDYHACALLRDGTVMCWGRNEFGQLGDGSTTDRSRPVVVTGLSSVARIAAGGNQTCVVTRAGGAKCWGDNAKGYLGDGTTVGRRNPVDVKGLTSGVADIAVGGFGACALTTAGGIKCWGDDGSGALGNNGSTQSNAPVDVIGLDHGVAAIAAGGGHMLALTTAGAVKAWGCNCAGELGTGTVADSHVPIDVAVEGQPLSSVSGGDVHSCVVTSPGGAICWGSGSAGRLGNGSFAGSDVPVGVLGLPATVSAVIAGGLSTCALTSAGGVLCWGDNTYGQIGDGTTKDTARPTDVAGLQGGIKAVDVGEYFACALTSGGGVLCWGDNQYGQMGNGTTDAGAVPFRGSTPVAVLKP